MRYERIVTEAKANNIAVQMVISGVAGSSGVPCKGAHASGVNPSIANYTAFVEEWVPHFNAMGVERFSLWNETNYPAFLCAGTVTQSGNVDTAICHSGAKASRAAAKKNSAKMTRKLFVAAYAAIQSLKQGGQVTSTTQVFIGETADVDLTFMKELFSGRKLVADGFSLHPYQYCQSPKTDKFYPKCYSSKMPGISQVHTAQKLLASLAHKGLFQTPHGGVVPLWLTEFGYFRTGGDSLPENMRAKWYPDAMDVVLKDGVRGMNLYQLWQSPKGEWDSSLLDLNGNPLPSFTALHNWAVKHHYKVAPL